MRLLSVLLGVGLVIGLSVFVMTKVTDQGRETAGDGGVRVKPGGEVEPVPEGVATAPSGAPDAATTVACATTAQTLRAAQESYRLLNGRYADLPTLVQSGSVRLPPDPLYEIESTDGYVTYQLVGRHGCP